MQNEQEKKQLLQTLAELGGKATAEDDVIFRGTQFVIPQRTTLQQAVSFLGQRIDEEEREQVFVRDYPYRPWDGAYNCYQTLVEMFGAVGAKEREGMFGQKIPPHRIAIQVGPGETVEVPWGDFTVPIFENTLFSTGATQSEEYGQVFRLSIVGPRKYRHEFEGFFRALQARLDAGNSIYQGKAITGQQMPEFLDLSGVDPTKVTYSNEVLEQLNANVWAVMQYTEEHRALGLPLKRSILLAGPYGTGKTLAAYLTAKDATESGWTFIYARPGRDDFHNVMQTARLYQPCCVFFEDAEVMANPDTNDGVSRILDTFDGIQAKGTELMVILTTNHPDQIHRGMMRPGRLDAIIHIGPLDRDGCERLIRAQMDHGMLEDSINWDAVADACEGYMPAFVKEAADRAIRHALVRGFGKVAKIATSDLVHAANGLRAQFEAMNDAPEAKGRDTLGRVLESTVQGAVAALAPADPDDARRDVWNYNALTELAKRN